jgi:hypothetical protein
VSPPTVHFKVSGNSQPRRGIAFVLIESAQYLQFAGPIELNRLFSWIGNRYGLPAHLVAYSKLVFLMCALANADRELSLLTIHDTVNEQAVSQIAVVPLIE